MKNIVISLLLLIAPVLSFAQLKLNSNGYLSFLTTNSPSSPISINGSGNSYCYIHCKSTKRIGLYCEITKDQNAQKYCGDFYVPINEQYSNSYNVGVRGRATLSMESQSKGYAYGVMGIAQNGNRTIGVFGRATGNHGSAGIYGTTTSADVGSVIAQLQQDFAGYFNGDVKVTGNFSFNGTLKGVLLGMAPSLSGNYRTINDVDSLSIVDKMSNLYATKYQVEKPQLIQSDFKEEVQTEGPDMEEEVTTPAYNVVEEQYYNKNHFALNAENLEEQFPDLVYEKEDGTKGINYMEMIPLLVQSINELNAKIEQLSGNDFARESNTAAIQKNILSSNVLYQNTPNPFKEKTVIRFRLADDATDAAICIFDLTGKQLKKLPISSGETSVSVNGWELGEGMFLYTLLVNGQEIDTKRMIITK